MYRRLVRELLVGGTTKLCSRKLAEAAGVTAAVVRRDLMVLSCCGNHRHGYDAGRLLSSIDEYLDAPGTEGVALVGTGGLGKAISAHLAGRTPKLPLRAVFDDDPAKAGRVVAGCRVKGIAELTRKLARKEKIRTAIVAVPASSAQAVAELCAKAGIRAILNFAPVQLRVPRHVYVCDIDLALVLEKAAFFARHVSRRRHHKGGPGQEHFPEAGEPSGGRVTDGSGARRSVGSRGPRESVEERALRRRPSTARLSSPKSVPSTSRGGAFGLRQGESQPIMS